MNMSKIIISVILFFTSFILLSFKLDFGSLEPWDEAWYADISRNVVRGDILILKSNGSPYIDHPPLGFWIEGLVFKLLGESDYSARLSSVIFSSLTISLIFLFGCKISDWKTGLMATVILFTCRWFLLRARTGNLESLLIFLQSLSIYLSWDTKRLKNIYLSWFILSISLLSKTFVSLFLLPLMIYNTVVFNKNNNLSAKNIRNIILLFVLPVGIWYAFNIAVFGKWFVEQNIFTVALREGDTNGLTLSNINSTLLLLRSVIHRWYKPLLLSYLFSFLLFLKNLNIRRVLVYFTFMFIPYIISSKTKSWHIIPATVPIALLVSCFLSQFAKKFANYSQLVHFALLGSILIIATVSFKEYIPEAYGKNSTPSDQKIIGDLIKYLPGPVYLHAYNNLEPTVIYYSERYVIVLNSSQDSSGIKMKRPYTYITDNNNIDMQDCKLITSIENVKVIHCTEQRN